MTSKSAAVYGSCGAILVACLAAANMPSQDAGTDMRRAARAARVHPDSIAADVESQAARLHARMADAPVPSGAVRNPFAFAASPRPSRTARRAEMVQAAIASEVTPVQPAQPALVLMGIAEETTASGLRRTAIIGLQQADGPEQSRAGGGDEIFMVGEGESVAGRYKVTKIGADAVELEDQVTKGYRRLALR